MSEMEEKSKRRELTNSTLIVAQSPFVCCCCTHHLAAMVGTSGLIIGNFTIGGIGVATFGSNILYQVLGERNSQTEPEEAVTTDSAFGLSLVDEHGGA
jgi:hypothetical protein